MFEKMVFNKLFQQIKVGKLHVKYWDGDSRTYGQKGGSASLTIKDPKVLPSLMKSTALGFGEAYMDGIVDTSDLPSLMILAAKNNQIVQNSPHLHLHKNRREKQASYIEHHYDLGNDFFKLWLDRSMTYSCAYFKKPVDSLEKAQEQKREHILKKLQLKKGMSLLDIGSGWGTLLIQAAKNYGATGLGITLSKEQYKHSTEEAKRLGLDNQVEFKLMNFHDLLDAKLTFDRIVSVGMFEHVGKENYGTYFKVIDHLLVDGGISVLHTISSQKETKTDPWVDKYIFPGGYLPTVSKVTSYFPEYNFRLLDYENLRFHYAMTLDEWTRRFLKHKKEVVKMYDEKFFRMWYFWLVGSTTGFRYGDLNLSQFIFSKGINNELPLTRDYLYK